MPESLPFADCPCGGKTELHSDPTKGDQWDKWRVVCLGCGNANIAWSRDAALKGWARSLASRHRPAPAGEAALREALESIRQFGSDTLSGPMGRADDRAWQREGVLEMTRRASAALRTAPGGEAKGA